MNKFEQASSLDQQMSPVVGPIYRAGAGGVCTEGEARAGRGSLYTEVQCIMGNGHPPPPWTDRMTDTHD